MKEILFQYKKVQTVFDDEILVLSICLQGKKTSSHIVTDGRKKRILTLSFGVEFVCLFPEKVKSQDDAKKVLPLYIEATQIIGDFTAKEHCSVRVDFNIDSKVRNYFFDFGDSNGSSKSKRSIFFNRGLSAKKIRVLHKMTTEKTNKQGETEHTEDISKILKQKVKLLREAVAIKQIAEFSELSVEESMQVLDTVNQTPFAKDVYASVQSRIQRLQTEVERRKTVSK